MTPLAKQSSNDGRNHGRPSVRGNRDETAQPGTVVVQPARDALGHPPSGAIRSARIRRLSALRRAGSRRAA